MHKRHFPDAFEVFDANITAFVHHSGAHYGNLKNDRRNLGKISQHSCLFKQVDFISKGEALSPECMPSVMCCGFESISAVDMEAGMLFHKLSSGMLLQIR